MDWAAENPNLLLAGAVVVIGLFGIGLRDLLRLSPVRTWAIARVAMQQSFRRRVHWVSPLVMLGVIVVAQLQKSLDAQDAIRQTTTVCLFASGLLVTLLAVMLACTSLPREIETRVIYTVATKPTTKLEIVLGKVIGFALVSLHILLIMGLFTFGYLRLRDWNMRRLLKSQLAVPGAVSEVNRATLEYYRDRGTLHAREMAWPHSLSIYAREPTSADDRWSPGAEEGEIAVRFTLDRRLIPPPQAADVSGSSMTGPVPAAPSPPVGSLVLQVPVRVQPAEIRQPWAIPSTGPAAGRRPNPRVSLMLADPDRNTVLLPRDLDPQQAGGWELPARGGAVHLVIRPEVLARLLPADSSLCQIDLLVTGVTDGYDYGIEPEELAIFVPYTAHVFRPAPDAQVEYRGRWGQFGQQLRGGGKRKDVAIYRFTQVPVASTSGRYTFEIRLGVERLEEEDLTRVALEVHNRTTGLRHGGVSAVVETNQPAYVEVPGEAVSGGEFDVLLRTASNAWLGLRCDQRASIRLVLQDQSFAWNLIKSLLVIWLMSLLVTIVSVFCSTFLSWPIAIVLTLVLLSGRWAADQVGDIAQAGLGRQLVNDMLPGSGAAESLAVSQTVDSMVAMMRTVSSFLPDISRFAAIRDISQGIALSASGVFWPSVQITTGFGIPLLVLAYVFLRLKEVAP